MAAVVLSTAVHAAIALTTPAATPLNDHPEVRSASSQSRPLRAVLVQSSSKLEPMLQRAALASLQRLVSSPSKILAVERPSSRSKAAAEQGVRRSHDTLAESSDETIGLPADESSDPGIKPTPLSYPILVLPPGDDPHRIGLVRLLLVVSSEGKVVHVIVTASTMSQDYIDRVTKSFEEMRFNPGLLRGAPHPGWYEVVVNFDFEPQGATSL